ncbi:EF-hand domain-containing family member C2-like [Adelges cooleyi]|uniref:EF-hand domain-containing family member C2-like n=1 Tax=Adelges cooleyi TaxID=133065 RepID=UPI00217FC862|nr:EF-hand domain-containing family member C2-like [Adelges cooleyi]
MACKLPMIPGFQICNKNMKSRHAKTPDLDIMNGVNIVRSLHVKHNKGKTNNYKAKYNFDMDLERQSTMPTWLVYDKQALTFDAYFEDNTPNDNYADSYNIRKCKIIYFLEDDTIKVIEPVVVNSGIPQGCLIKRHAIPVPNSDGECYQIYDLNVGTTVEFYGKNFTITGADSFTREFLKNSGMDVPDNLPMPDDSSSVTRTETKHEQQDLLRNAIEFDGILNFKGYWDDRHNVDGILHYFEIQYFLIDDTMKIVERDPNNKLKTFLKRQKIPKNNEYIKPPGSCEPYDLLNVLGANPLNRWFAFDPLSNLRGANNTHYKSNDLYIGAEINVYGRTIVLNYCDEFTRQFYIDNGISHFSPVCTPRETEEVENATTKKLSVQRDDNRILSKLQNDGNNSIESLVFKAKMLSNEPDDEIRDFVVKCQLNDQSFTVFEVKGKRAGKQFLSKRNIQSEGTESIAFNLYAGVELTIDSFQFVLTDVDDRTLRFMMNHPVEFPHSDVQSLMNQVIGIGQTAIDSMYSVDFKGKDVMDRDEFIQILSDTVKQLSFHGVLVLALRYKKPQDKRRDVSDDRFRSILQDELRRELFASFDGLEINLKQRNRDNRDGYLDRESVLRALKSSKIPFSVEITDTLLDKFTNRSTKKVCYVDLLKYLDYNSESAASSQDSIKDLLFRKPERVLVRTREFIDDLRRQFYR